LKTQTEIVSATESVVTTWLTLRARKFVEAQKDTMNVNPFMLPLVAALHGTDTVEEMGELLLGAHLIGGHNTGFGKLIDEKLLPAVFETSKLSAKFRATTPPYTQAAFNDIDHIVHRATYDDLLSLKASPWTLNLSVARDLNASFEQIRDHQMEPNPGKYGEIAMGVIYGTASALTDKYQILRGETKAQRSKHKVSDLTGTVNVYAGRDFWTWLNEGEQLTQDWLLEGILTAASKFGTASDQKSLVKAMVTDSKSLTKLGTTAGKLNWSAFLESING
jgi:hypothetical protein